MTRKRLIIIFAVVLAVLTVAVFLFFNNLPAPKVLIVTPQDGSTKVALDSTVNFTFDRNLSDIDKGKLSIDLSPQEDFGESWVNKELVITFKNNLKTLTKYVVNVSYNKQMIFTFSFNTVPFTADELKILQNSKNTQLPGDYVFSQVLNNMYTKYPWLSKLPIETPSYRIVYDYAKNSFRIRLLVSTSNDQEKQQIVDQALSNIKAIGFSGTPIPYYVLTQ